MSAVQKSIVTIRIPDKSGIQMVQTCPVVEWGSSEVVSIGLIWIGFVSFSYNGVYFLLFIFNGTLTQYLSAQFTRLFKQHF